MKEQDYRNLQNQYEKEFAQKMKEWHGKYFQHLYLNQKLDEMYKKVEKTRDLSNQDLMAYLCTRTENDKINSEFKIISTETNEIWIKIQELDKKVLTENNVNPIYIGWDEKNGRLLYYLDFK